MADVLPFRIINGGKRAARPARLSRAQQLLEALERDQPDSAEFVENILSRMVALHGGVDLRVAPRRTQ